MKSITEFANFILNNGLKAKAALAAEGKTPEEIQTSLGETFKYEGDKLKYFVAALEIAGQNQENLKRILVLSFGEGENTPPKAVKVEEHHYLPEFNPTSVYKAAPKSDDKGRGKGRGGRGEKKGGSPWGMSPEEKAAKSGKGAAANKPKPT